MEEKKRNFFKDIWTSIRDFEKYEEFAGDRLTKTIKYLILLTLIFVLIISTVYTYKFYITITEVKQYISQNIDDIKLSNRQIRSCIKATVNYRK